MLSRSIRTYEVKLYLAGPIDIAKQILREEAAKEGLCITIQPTLYIYTQGEETGYVVGFMQYPRFPKPEQEIYHRAKEIGIALMQKTFQGSFSVVAPDRTEFISIRECDML